MKLKKIVFGHEYSPFGELIFRGFAGFSMAFAHGLNKVPPSGGFIEMLSEEGLPFAVFFAWAAGLAEFLGGIFLGIGFATRVSGFLLFLTMIYAGLIHHAPDPFGSKEKALLYAVIALYFTLRGAGKYSIDKSIRHQK